MNSYVDFFYIANDEGIKIPSAIEPNQNRKEDSGLNRNKKQPFQRTEENLIWLCDILMEAESNHRDGLHDKCLDEYKKVAHQFE